MLAHVRKQAGVRLVGEAGRDKVRMGRYDDGFDKGTVCPQAYDRYRQAGGGGCACHYEASRATSGAFRQVSWSSWAALSCAPGVLKSIRGVSGGYYLAKPADQIRIGDVLRATEGSCMPVACVDDEGKCDHCGAAARRAASGGGWAMPSTPISTASRLPMCWRATWRHSRFQGCNPSSETGAGKRDGLQLASCSPSFSFNQVLWLCVRKKPWLGCRARVSLHERSFRQGVGDRQAADARPGSAGDGLRCNALRPVAIVGAIPRRARSA